MAITIDPLTFIISIPKADLTLIQSSPTEIRELDLNWFRLQLKALEAHEQGMYLTKTHTHNTEVSLGGLTFARVIEILDPYTITFEDGQYAVNLIGANSNVGDKINVNQVSVRSANSAGLISSPDVEYASFNGGVIVDANSGITGTIFPRGTERMKVNNITDALLIANYRGFNKIFFDSDYSLGSGAALDNFILEGQSHVNINIDIDPDADVQNTTILESTISGTLDGGNSLTRCIIRDINYLNGHIHNSALEGTITLGGNDDAYIMNCSQSDWNTVPTIDMAGSGQNLIMIDYTGLLQINNITGSDVKVGIGLDGGRIVLGSDITTGFIHVSGIGQLYDTSGNHVYSGSWNGATIVNELISKHTIAEAVLDEQLSEHLGVGTIGEAISDAGASGNPWNAPVTGNTDPGTFGELVGKKLLTFAKWFGLK